MRIPEVQDELRYIAGRLQELAKELSRRPALKRTDRKPSRRMTAEVRTEIREMARLHPHLTQMEISDRVGVNSGRVSETLRGFRR